MKQKITILLMIGFISLSSFAQDCNIGNQVKTAGFGKDSEFGTDFFMGIKRTLTKEATLTAINMIGNDTKVRFKMAVYNDKGGKPYQLMAQTEIGIVGEGIVSLPVARTLLPTGDYWIMGIYEASNKSNYSSDMNVNATNNAYAGGPQKFSDKLPTVITSINSYKGIDLLYFLSLECGNTLSSENFDLNDNISLYPNPSSDIINIFGGSVGSKYSILNTLGSVVLDGNITESKVINIESLSTGIYFIQLEDSKIIRFVKR